MSFSRWLGRGSPGLPRTVPSRRTCARLLRPRFRPCARARRSLDPSKFRVFPCPVPYGVRNALGISRFLSPFFYALCLAFLPLFFPKSKRLDTHLSVLRFQGASRFHLDSGIPAHVRALSHKNTSHGGSSGINHGFIIFPTTSSWFFIGMQNFVVSEDRPPGQKG